MKKGLFILFSLFSKMLWAQTEISGPFEFYNVSSTYVFADTAFIRASPGLKSNVLDTVYAGHEVFLLNKTEIILASSGKKAPWFKVSYVQNGAKKQGFIWGALLSPSAHRRGDIKLVYGINGVKNAKFTDWEGSLQEDTCAIVALKLIHKSVLLKKEMWATPYTDSFSAASAQIIDNPGLNNIKFAFNFSFSGEACGIPTLHYYQLITTDNKIIRLPELTSQSEAGIYSITQEYFFPKDKDGRPKQIVFHEALWQLDEEPSEEERGETKDTYKYYSWDGTALKRLPTNKI